MPPVQRVRPRLGDVIEISTPLGLAYAHYTHTHESFGALLRVLPGLHKSRPPDFSAVVQAEPQFITFFPLGAACNRRIVKIVANEVLPRAAMVFPIFRSCVRTTNGRGPWWLWDGINEWRVGDLEPGMEQLPLRGIWNDTLLIQRIAERWKHEMNA
jgi:hypothetical protein